MDLLLELLLELLLKLLLLRSRAIRPPPTPAQQWQAQRRRRPPVRHGDTEPAAGSQRGEQSGRGGRRLRQAQVLKHVLRQECARTVYAAVSTRQKPQRAEVALVPHVEFVDACGEPAVLGVIVRAQDHT